MPTATVAGNVLVFPHRMSDGLIRSDDDITVNVPLLFLFTISRLDMLVRSSPGTGMQTATVPLKLWDNIGARSASMTEISVLVSAEGVAVMRHPSVGSGTVFGHENSDDFSVRDYSGSCGN